ncbi:MAG TPA: hypothetical protein ENJ31_03775 [Anaerolineae bacterium]|nr:hypothetical protein [Anaerolineae bacterium]
MENLDLRLLQFLIFALIGAVVLILIILAIYVIIANRRERERLEKTYEEAIEEAKLAPRPALQVKGQVLALVREEEGAPIQVEIAGDKYKNMAEVRDPNLKRQIIGAAMELIQFTGVLTAGAESPPPPPARADTWREDMRRDSQSQLQRIQAQPAPGSSPTPSAPPAPQDVEEQFLSLLSEMGQTPSSPEKPTLVKSLQRRLTPKLPDSSRPRTFVDDIEDILQRRILMVPVMIGRDLHVRPGSDGSVRFVFEGREYENLDDVPNLTARQLIKDAIQEWDETT